MQRGVKVAKSTVSGAVIVRQKQQPRNFSIDHHVHHPGCPCSAGRDPIFFNRGMNKVIEAAQKESSRPSFRRRTIRRKTPNLFDPRRSASTTTLGAQDTDYAFEMAASNIRYGRGVTREVGDDLVDLGAKNVLVVTDRNLASIPNGPVDVVMDSLKRAKVNFKVYDRVRVEPTDSSFKDAINFAQSDQFDAYVAVGGGSVIDTCKAANLYATYPADFLAYVNPPIGQGLPPPGPLKPLIAIPTTAGTGSETTGVAIFDFEEMNAKTGIAHRTLKPKLGIVDPENIRSLPPTVRAASGFDVLCHSLESWTAIPYNMRSPRPSSPMKRPAYQGANPISDFWSLKSLEMCAKWLPIAATDPSNEEAEAQMILASTYAGIGFGNAGVHLCHGMSYPVSGLVKSWRPNDYKGVEGPFIPHGYSVVLHAPAVFRFTAPADPERHLRAAAILGADVSRAKPEDAGRILADALLPIMRKLWVPNGLKDLGFTEKDLPELVQGALPQHRVIKLAPRFTGEQELFDLYSNSMTIY